MMQGMDPVRNRERKSPTTEGTLLGYLNQIGYSVEKATFAFYF